MSSFQRIAQTRDGTLFRRIYHDILDLDDDSPLVLAFHHDGIRNLIDLVSLSSEVIDQLEYVPRPGEPSTVIDSGSTNLVKWFINWVRYLMACNGRAPLSLDQWDAIQKVDFEIFLQMKGTNIDTLLRSMLPPTDKTNVDALTGKLAAAELGKDNLTNFPKDAHLDPIEGEMSSKLNSELSAEGESSRILMLNEIEANPMPVEVSMNENLANLHELSTYLTDQLKEISTLIAQARCTQVYEQGLRYR